MTCNEPQNHRRDILSALWLSENCGRDEDSSPFTSTLCHKRSWILQVNAGVNEFTCPIGKIVRGSLRTTNCAPSSELWKAQRVWILHHVTEQRVEACEWMFLNNLTVYRGTERFLKRLVVSDLRCMDCEVDATFFDCMASKDRKLAA